MTARALARIWIAALVLAIAAAAILTALGTEPGDAPPVPDGEEIALIGTSLMRYAVPLDAGADGLLGDGLRHSRLVAPLLPEREATALLAAAVDDGAHDVFLEINPYAFDFAGPASIAAATEPGAAKWLAEGIDWLSGGLRRGVLRLVSAEAAPASLDPATVYDGTSVDLSVVYPLRLHPPLDLPALRAVVAAARARGVRIVLVSPPRSQAAVDYIGPAAMAELTVHLQALADELGVELWLVGPAWANVNFIDQAHLNSRGRARFVAELRARYGTPQ